MRLERQATLPYSRFLQLPPRPSRPAPGARRTGYPQITLSTYVHTNPGPFNGHIFSVDNTWVSLPSFTWVFGNAFASLPLRLGAGGNMLVLGLPYQSISYQGYYVQDTWQFNPKLSPTLGLRWEIPGV